MTAWSLKTMHGFLTHADHHDRPVCLVQHDPSALHIHDARYEADGCTLCAFVLSLAALPSVIIFAEQGAGKPAEQRPLYYQVPAAYAAPGAVPSRGPPVG